MKKWQYLLGTAMPTLVLGGGGAVAAVMTNQLLLFLAAEYMILSGGGDFQHQSAPAGDQTGEGEGSS